MSEPIDYETLGHGELTRPSDDVSHLIACNKELARRSEVLAEAMLNSARRHTILRLRHKSMIEALDLCVASLDQLLPHLGKVPADIGLLNEALCAARPLLLGDE